MTPRGAFRVCGVRIDALDADTAADELIDKAGQPMAIHLCNAYTLSLARSRPEFAEVLDRGDLNLPDGMPLVWIARRLGLPLDDRAYGPDVMAGVLDRGRERGVRHYLYGSTPEVIDDLCACIDSRWPGCDVVGAESPPFRSLSSDEQDSMLDRVRSAGADVVWVGLGTPGQDEFVDRHRDQLGATLVAVGAAFDFFAGNKPQAPRAVQRAGMEWAWRLASEPRRLAGRYVVGNTRFVIGCIRDRPVGLADHG